MLGPLVAVFLLQAAQAAPPLPPADPPRAAWSNATDFALIADERDSLAGISRLAVRVLIAEGLDPALASDALTSTVAFRLEQAGLVVVPTRAVEDPLLVVTVGVVDDHETRTGAPRVYRIDADLLQLVRLSDRDARARLMMASTWHAGTAGTLPSSTADDLRARIADIVDAFLADHRTANTPTAPLVIPRP